MMQVLFRLFRLRTLKHPPPPFRIVVLLSVILAYGTTGYLYFELSQNPDLLWTDGLWYSIVTMTTVGYGDFFPKTPGGRFFVGVPLMLFGIGLLGYVLSLAASSLVEARNKELHGMGTHDLEDHLVLINFPSLGKVLRVLTELANDTQYGVRNVVLVDEDLVELPPELHDKGVVYVRGMPTRDETLNRANLDRAKYAVVLSKRPGDPHSDELSVSITLAIEARTRKIHTVVECVDYGAQELLRKAGCDSIVCTSRFDAHFLSHELLNPGVQEVIEELTSNLQGEQIYITRYAGKKKTTFGEVAERCRAAGHLAIGIHASKTARLNVGADQPLEPGDGVITIGPKRLAEL